MMKKWVKIGQITSPKGIKGNFKIAFESREAMELMPFYNSDGQKMEITLSQIQGNMAVGHLTDINDRNSAEKLRGCAIFSNRDEMPSLPDGKYYYADLIGLDVLDENQQLIGKVSSVDNFGAGDILTIKTSKEEQMVVFTDDNVPLIDLDKNYMVVRMPTYAGENNEG